MTPIRSVAVFCGAHPGDSPAFRRAAEDLGEGLARAGIRLVFGGGRVGLMGAVADAALAADGEVIGVIPEFLTRQEVAHERVTDMIVTESMHERKQRMYELSDAFVSLPGGLGTYDETIEIITWRQLHLHNKPIVLCDVAGSSEPLIAAIEAAIVRGFAPVSARRLFMVAHGPSDTIAALKAERAGQGVEASRL